MKTTLTLERPGMDTIRLQTCVDDVAALASLIEQRFLAVGGTLGTAIEATNRILPSFDALYATLQAPEMGRAVGNLREVAEQLTVLVADARQNEALLGDLLALAERLASRITRMRAALRGVDVLAVNAKIAASHVRDLDQSMESFAGEIEKALKLFQGNLEVVAAKLNTVVAELRRTRQEQQQVLKQRNDASRRIAESLRATLELVEDRRYRAASAAGDVRRKAAEISRDISSTIMALQIGDATRQRLEHVASGLATCRGGEAAAGPDTPLLQDVVCHLQSLQLQATAEEFERNTATIRQGLVQLAVATGEILSLGQEAYSRGSLSHGSFLLGLREEVVAVKDLLLGVQAAETKAGALVGEALQSIEGLARYVKAIQLLETDIRVLALNTTLKCSRLGNAGLSLAVIAQELRSCSVSIASDAGAALKDLHDLVAAGSVGAQKAVGATSARFDGLIERMEASADTLYEAGMQLSDSLAALGEDGRTVNAIVEDAGVLIGEQMGLAGTIAGLSNQLRGPQLDPLAVKALVSGHAAVFADMRRSYTMEQERAVFDAFAGYAVPAAPAPSEKDPAEMDLDEFFF